MNEFVDSPPMKTACSGGLLGTIPEPAVSGPFGKSKNHWCCTGKGQTKDDNHCAGNTTLGIKYKMTYKAGNKHNMRKEASLEAEIVGTIQRGDIIRVVEVLGPLDTGLLVWVKLSSGAWSLAKSGGPGSRPSRAAVVYLEIADLNSLATISDDVPKPVTCPPNTIKCTTKTLCEIIPTGKMCNDGAWMDKTPKKPGAPSSGGGTGGDGDDGLGTVAICAIIVVVIIVFTLIAKCIIFYNKEMAELNWLIRRKNMGF